ncbi:hypothetical protein PUN28_005488 [Cardiocondyla obscurior]|uniref:RING-type domain-containing protein n=1 Tax=Cardiocondyla obscurior TaxID=286306 RepID=A0AAW2GI14_9HYME
MGTKRNYNCESIWNWHPEIVLVSKSPVTYKGFLIVSHSLYTSANTGCFRIKLKLIMPNYPSFCNAEISFGKQIAYLRNKEFSKDVKESMKSAQTVQSFLLQLQIIISKYIWNTDNNIDSKVETVNLLNDFVSRKNVLQDIKAALQSSSDVQLSCDGNLNIIKLSLRGISLKLKRCNNAGTPWKVVSSDLLDIPAFENLEMNVTSLSVAMTKLTWKVELLERAWEQLKEIDENCWVIDPPEPNKSHMYRRIHLSQSISVTITINPLSPTAVPTITFSGSDNEVKRQKDEVSNNIHNWNQECNIIENLKKLLNMYEFPEQQDSLDDVKGIISNCECGICFSEKSETDKLPDKICNNIKCMKHFHSACLSKWLQTNAGNQVVFGYIHGNCPHCKESISCPVE